MNIPSGIVTFLFTDIESCTKLSQEFPETLQSALERHHSIMQNAIELNNGFVFEIKSVQNVLFEFTINPVGMTY